MADTEPNPTLRPWSITKSEWDGIGETPGGARLYGRILTLVGILFSVGLMFTPTIIGSMVKSAPPASIGWMFRGMGAAFIVFVVLLEVWKRFAKRRWKSMGPIVWDSQGCFCPWCKVRVDEHPCPGHGFTREDQPTLIAYWETLPTKAPGNIVRAVAELRRAARKQPSFWQLLGPLQRAYFASVAATNDPDATPLQRLRASLPWMAVQFAAGAIALVAALWLLPRQFAVGLLSGCWPYLLIGPVFILIGPIVRIGRPRCSACGQLCASAQPTLCAECGADLTKPAAVRRDERSRRKGLLLLVPLGLALALAVFQDSIVAALPTPLRNFYWTNIKAPLRYWQNLNPATMTQGEVDEAARLLIDCAAPGGPRPVFAFDFIGRAQKAGKVTDATIEAAARGTVRARLELAQANGAVTAVVHPEFGEIILPYDMIGRLVFGGVSVDGGPYTAPADWSLFERDTNEFWREAWDSCSSCPEKIPDGKLVFRTELGALGAGAHTIRARCWIVLRDGTTERFQPVFDEHGQLRAPEGATVYELPLEATLDSR